MHLRTKGVEGAGQTGRLLDRQTAGGKYVADSACAPSELLGA